ncbi:MAG: T9SS type A sorting domain-containing protein [Candidatus Kapabacteria bacterium]|nr:T9SS type A sorting domain-containing protein [Candidatus Kapabacteria bacterium]
MKRLFLICVSIFISFYYSSFSNFFIENKGQIQIDNLNILYYTFYQNYQIYICEDKILIYDDDKDKPDLIYDYAKNKITDITTTLNQTYLNYFYYDFKANNVRTYSAIHFLENKNIKLTFEFSQEILKIYSIDKSINNLQINLDKKTDKKGNNSIQALDGIVWSTLYGGNNTDLGVCTAIDKKTNSIYFMGFTSSPNYPVKNPSTKYGGSIDITYTKFDIDGNLIWATIMGSSGRDYVHSCAFDSIGNIWTVGEGYGASDFPVTSNAFQKKLNGSADGEVVCISENGYVLYSTYIGGSSDEALTNICVDHNNNIWCVGRTNSPNFPVTIDAKKKIKYEYYETPILKFSNDGKLIYSSFFGGTSSATLTLADAIAINSDNDIIIAGYSNSPNIQTTYDAFQITNAGGWDSFVAKLQQNGQIIWCTYIGGSNTDYGSNMTLDKMDNIYIEHYSRSTDLPIVNSSLFSNNSGGLDVYLTKLDKNGDLLTSSYFGGNQDEGEDFGGWAYIGGGITMTPKNNILVYFKTKSQNIPTSTNAFQQNLIGDYDPFILLLDSNLNFIDATYFGGSTTENTGNINAFADSTIVICGQTMSSNFPLKNPTQSVRSGASDQFLAIIGNALKIPPPPPDTIPPSITSFVDSCEIIRTISVADNQLDLSGIKDINIIKSDNCDISITNKTQTTAVIIIQLIDTEQNGYYTIDVIDNAGNKTTLKDSLLASRHNYLSFTPKPFYDFGKLKFGEFRCDNITIHNNSPENIELKDLSIVKNIDFSIPQSQFPILVPANDSVNLEVCFRAKFPLYGIYRDTITYFNNCVYARIPLVAEIDTANYNAISRCDIIINIISNYDSLSDPEPVLYPNPNRGIVWLNSNYKKDDISLEIYNILGEQIKSLQFEASTLPIEIDLSKIIDGNYIFIIRQKNIVSINKILLIK